MGVSLASVLPNYFNIFQVLQGLLCQRHIVKQSLLFVSESTNRTQLDVCADRYVPVETCPSLTQPLQTHH